jgi:hypothetical protein
MTKLAKVILSETRSELLRAVVELAQILAEGFERVYIEVDHVA